MRNFLQLLPLMFAIFVPAMTMRAFSEERQSGSIEILLTMPVTSLDVVVGKIMAATIFVAAALVPTLIYLFTVAAVGRPGRGSPGGGVFRRPLLAGPWPPSESAPRLLHPESDHRLHHGAFGQLRPLAGEQDHHVPAGQAALPGVSGNGFSFPQPVKGTSRFQGRDILSIHHGPVDHGGGENH